MSMTNLIISRSFLTSSCKCGKRVFTKFLLYNKQGHKLFKQRQAKKPDSDIPIARRGLKLTGYKDGDRFVEVPEMIPEIIVPNLKDFNLKPYVSYKTQTISQEKFTAKHLFDIVYKEKIVKDFKNNKLDASGQPLHPSKEEEMTAQEARDIASKSGSDIFTNPPHPVGTHFLEKLK